MNSTVAVNVLITFMIMMAMMMMTMAYLADLTLSISFFFSSLSAAPASSSFISSLMEHIKTNKLPAEHEHKVFGFIYAWHTGNYRPAWTPLDYNAHHRTLSHLQSWPFIIALLFRIMRLQTMKLNVQSDMNASWTFEHVRSACTTSLRLNSAVRSSKIIKSFWILNLSEP